MFTCSPDVAKSKYFSHNKVSVKEIQTKSSPENTIFIHNSNQINYVFCMRNE